MADQDVRISVYQELEKQIVQKDCVWIPLFLEEHLLVKSPAIPGFPSSGMNGGGQLLSKCLRIRMTEAFCREDGFRERGDFSARGALGYNGPAQSRKEGHNGRGKWQIRDYQS